MPPGDDEFDRGPTARRDKRGPSYDQDYARAQMDRGSYGLVSAAYWIVRAIQGLFGLLRRRAAWESRSAARSWLARSRSLDGKAKSMVGTFLSSALAIAVLVVVVIAVPIHRDLDEAREDKTGGLARIASRRA
jgi:hypothetical protein